MSSGRAQDVQISDGECGTVFGNSLFGLCLSHRVKRKMGEACRR